MVMNTHCLTLSVLEGEFSICRLEPFVNIPQWANQGEFFSITRSSEELSIVCESKYVPAAVKADTSWRGLKVEGPLDFSLTGILASLATSLANEGISIFAISTFDTDYLLVKASQLNNACEALIHAGHTVN